MGLRQPLVSAARGWELASLPGFAHSASLLSFHVTCEDGNLFLSHAQAVRCPSGLCLSFLAMGAALYSPCPRPHLQGRPYRLRTKVARLLFLPCSFLLLWDLPWTSTLPNRDSQQKSGGRNDLALLIIDNAIKNKDNSFFP